MVREIANLEKQMYTHARNLEFEAAAKLRDKIYFLNERFQLNDIY
jgi:excinuclease ABC subunit B